MWLLSGQVAWRKSGGRSRETEKDQVNLWQKIKIRGGRGGKLNVVKHGT